MKKQTVAERDAGGYSGRVAVNRRREEERK
jgi:hypothetical protein